MLRAVLLGEGGTGKSYAIKAVTALCEDLHRPEAILKISQFGSTASAIGGYTLSWIVGQYSGKQKKKPQFNISKHEELLAKASLIIIEEYSLADKRCLAELDCALRQAKKRGDVTFGGVDVLLAGDCYQLGPVGSTMLHEDSGKETSLAYLTAVFFSEFTSVFILTEQVRYSGSKRLIQLCRGLRSNQLKQDNVRFLNERIKQIEEIDFVHSILLVATRPKRKVFMQEYHKRMSERNGGSCIGWRATVSGTRGVAEEALQKVINDLDAKFYAGRESSNFGKPLPGFSMFREGELVCCRENLQVDGNIANGTFGKIVEFRFPVGTTYTDHNKDGIMCRLASNPPDCVIIEMMTDGVNVPQWGTKRRPIWLHSAETQLDINGCRSSHSFSNIPLGSAVVSTVHGIQGKTIPESFNIVISDLRRFWRSFPAAGLYVAFTRIVNENLAHSTRPQIYPCKLEAIRSQSRDDGRVWTALVSL